VEPGQLLERILPEFTGKAGVNPGNGGFQCIKQENLIEGFAKRIIPAGSNVRAVQTAIALGFEKFEGVMLDIGLGEERHLLCSFSLFYIPIKIFVGTHVNKG
jgi:hypothetical protein